jgi:F0F1-type ATP synthase assembly protein I
MRETGHALNLLFRVGALYLVSTFGMLGFGIGVDRAMGTAPLGTLAFMVTGIVLGTVAVYRVVRDANNRVAPPLPPQTKSDESQSRDELRGGQ